MVLDPSQGKGHPMPGRYFYIELHPKEKYRFRCPQHSDIRGRTRVQVGDKEPITVESLVYDDTENLERAGGLNALVKPEEEVLEEKFGISRTQLEHEVNAVTFDGDQHVKRRQKVDPKWRWLYDLKVEISGQLQGTGALKYDAPVINDDYIFESLLQQYLGEGYRALHRTEYEFQKYMSDLNNVFRTVADKQPWDKQVFGKDFCKAIRQELKTKQQEPEWGCNAISQDIKDRKKKEKSLVEPEDGEGAHRIPCVLCPTCRTKVEKKRILRECFLFEDATNIVERERNRIQLGETPYEVDAPREPATSPWQNNIQFAEPLYGKIYSTGDESYGRSKAAGSGG